MKKLASGLLLLLAFVPVVSFSNVFVPGVDGKIFTYRLFVFALSIIIFLIVLKKDGESDSVINQLRLVIRRPIFIVLSIGTVLLLISTIAAHNPSLAFFGDIDRGEGFLTLFSLYILFVYMSVLFTKKQWQNFYLFTVLASFCLFLYQCWQAAHGMVRASSLLSNPIFLAGFYLFSMFAGLYLYATKDKYGRSFAPIVGVAGMAISVFGILLTKTRGTLLGMLGALVAASLIGLIIGKQYRIGKYLVRSISAAILTILIVFSSILFATRSSSLWKSIPGFDRLTNTTIANSGSRLLFLDITKKGFLNSTFKEKMIGWGWDNYRYFWTKNYDPKVYLFDPAIADRAHNKIADSLIMTGLLGLLAYLSLWYFFFRYGIRLIKKNVMLGFSVIFIGVSYFIHNMFAFDTPVILFSFYAVLAFLEHYTYAE